MNIKQLLKVSLLGTLSFGIMQARVLQTPLPLYFAPYHTPLYRLALETDKCWEIDIWGASYFRQADAAWGNCGEREVIPLTQLIFGQPNFRVVQAFPNSAVGVAFDNPFISISTLRPRFEYQERGAFFGANIIGAFGCDNKWSAGVRARLPIRDINVQEVCGGGLAGSDTVGDTLNDVFQTRFETISTGLVTRTNEVFAARLDFLSLLPRISLNAMGLTDPLVVYSDPNASGHITIGQVDITGNQPTVGPLLPNQPPVAAIERIDGTMPINERWGNFQTAITGVIADDGSGLVNDERGRFASDVNYTPLASNVPNQSRLFIVPTLNIIPPREGELTDGALAILSAITQSISGIDTSVTDFFEDTGIDFCNGRSKGLGDLDVEVFVGRAFGCDLQWWEETQFGFRFPTGDKLCDCREVIRQPLGNNGHFEIRIAQQFGWDAHERVRLKFDGMYYFVLSKREQVAAPFAGATIRNFGPCINADVKWQYFQGHFDLTFLASQCCGFDAGYEVYFKRCDQISLCQTSATDFAGRVNQPLDVRLLERDTERIAHRVRGEFFLSTGACELFTGFEYTVAGKNVTRDTDYYLGIKVMF